MKVWIFSISIVGFIFQITLPSAVTPLLSSTSLKHTDTENYYDRDSLEVNKKLVRLFLRLAFYTANRVVHLKNIEKNEAINRLDHDLQNLTLNEIIESQSQNILSAPISEQNSTAEIQSRILLPFGIKSITNTWNPDKVIGNVDKIIDVKNGDVNIPVLKVTGNQPEGPLNLRFPKPINENFDNSQKSGTNDFSSINQISNLRSQTVSHIGNFLSGPTSLLSASKLGNASNIQGATENVAIFESAQGNSGGGVELSPRIFADIEESNNTTIEIGNIINTKVEIPIIKLDQPVAPRIDVNTTLIQNMNITNDEIQIQQQGLLGIHNNAKRVPVSDDRSRRDVKEFANNSSNNSTFGFSLDETDDNYGSSLDPLITKIKLQDIADEITKA